ncbi:hypothetical protein [Novacetimonas hansenii]|uniref:hypothetical protein n=1 Tax=Novacetimonas hansenii TaxID=436 RepID=UPI0038D01408
MPVRQRLPGPAADAAPPPGARCTAAAAACTRRQPVRAWVPVANGDFIARGVLLIMVFMSVGTWVIMIKKFFEQASLFSAGKDVTSKFWTKPTIKQGADALPANSRSAISRKPV